MNRVTQPYGKENPATSRRAARGRPPRGISVSATLSALLLPLLWGCAGPGHGTAGGGARPAIGAAPTGVAPIGAARSAETVVAAPELPLAGGALGGGPLAPVEQALASGQPEAALRLLDGIRAGGGGTESVPSSELHRLRGTAYYALGKWGLARRYLAKGLSAAHGSERSRQLARLVHCARELGATSDVERFSRALGEALDRPDVRNIIAGNDPLITAGARAVAATPEIRPESAPAPARPAPRSSTPSHRAGTLAALEILPRSSWNARPIASNISPMRGVDKVTIHHTGDDAVWLQAQTEVASTISAIQRYHQRERSWADIGYHFLIDRSGAIWQGRPLSYQGAHAGGVANRNNIGVVLLGNYFKQTPSREQVISLTRLVAALSDAYSIAPENVYTHREVAAGSTSCPGPSLARIVHSLRTELRRHALALAD